MEHKKLMRHDPSPGSETNGDGRDLNRSALALLRRRNGFLENQSLSANMLVNKYDAETGYMVRVSHLKSPLVSSLAGGGYYVVQLPPNLRFIR